MEKESVLKSLVIAKTISSAIKAESRETQKVFQASLENASSAIVQAVKDIKEVNIPEYPAFPTIPDYPKFPDFPKFPEFPKEIAVNTVDLSNVEDSLSKILSKEVDLRPLIDEFKKTKDVERLVKAIKEIKTVDYTEAFTSLATKLEELGDEIKKKKLPLSDDGRIQVEVDRTGGGGGGAGGLSTVDSTKLQTLATEATQLLVKSAIENIVPAPVGGATEVTALDIKSLTETLQELNHRLVFLAGLANAGAPALRVIPIGSFATSVIGSVSVTTLTNFGTGVPASLVAQAQFNLTAIQSNINNVTV